MEYPPAAIALLREYMGNKNNALRLPSAGNSMFPLLRPGDTLTIQPANISQLAIGDMVVFAHEGMLLCHRVIAKHRFTSQGPAVITKSDISASADPASTQEKLLGKVVAIQKSRSCRTINLERGVWVLLNRFLGLSHLSIYVLWRAFKPLKNFLLTPAFNTK